MSEERSAGETPEMRDACPKVCGRIAASFWRASVEMFRPGAAKSKVDSDLKLTTKQFSVDFIACTSKILGNIGYNRAQGADMHVPMTRNRHPVFGALSGSSQHHVTAFLPDDRMSR